MSATTTAIDIDVNGNFSIIPLLFCISKYPFSASSSVKKSLILLSNLAIILWHKFSTSVYGTIAIKSSPPTCPTNPLPPSVWISSVIMFAVY